MAECILYNRASLLAETSRMAEVVDHEHEFKKHRVCK